MGHAVLVRKRAAERTQPVCPETGQRFETAVLTAKEELAMPDPKNFDLDFRPRSYWGPASLEKHFGSTIQGEVRRKLVRENLEQGIEPAPGLLTPELSEPNRDAFGSIHPHFMGGEYLPGMEEDEVEIGRAVLDSVTRDVISIRARRKEGLIQYSVVDEYEGDYEYKANP